MLRHDRLVWFDINNPLLLTIVPFTGIISPFNCQGKNKLQTAWELPAALTQDRQISASGCFLLFIFLRRDIVNCKKSSYLLLVNYPVYVLNHFEVTSLYLWISISTVRSLKTKPPLQHTLRAERHGPTTRVGDVFVSEWPYRLSLSPGGWLRHIIRRRSLEENPFILWSWQCNRKITYQSI